MAAPCIFDVNDRNVDSHVLKKSHEMPVLLGFWATW
jgi:thioredoxin-like negative regulator of GroEL